MKLDEFHRATSEQIRYIEILANDIRLNRIQRNDFVSLRVGRNIKYLDELTKLEASTIIAALKAKKEENAETR